MRLKVYYLNWTLIEEELIWDKASFILSWAKLKRWAVQTLSTLSLFICSLHIHKGLNPKFCVFSSRPPFLPNLCWISTIPAHRRDNGVHRPDSLAILPFSGECDGEGSPPCHIQYMRLLREAAGPSRESHRYSPRLCFAWWYCRYS